MIKFKNLVINKLGILTEEVLENARIKLGLDDEGFRKFLQQDQTLFDILDESISTFMLEQIDSNYISSWLRKTKKNQSVIIKEFPDFFRNYFLYVHTANKIFDQIEKETVGTEAKIKEVTLFCMLGHLCRMSDEIGILLSNGLTKAALSSWRVFYEYCVIGIFLMKHDSNDLYERYANHGHKNVEKQKTSFNKHFEALKFPALDEKLQLDISSKTTEIKDKYGNDFFEEYAWAKDILNKGKKRINFWDIESNADMGLYRPFYIWASGIIHPTFHSMTDYFDKNGKLVIGNINTQKLDFKSYIDPAQLTLIVFNVFLDHFLYHYSVNVEYRANTMLLREIIERLKLSFDLYNE